MLNSIIKKNDFKSVKSGNNLKEFVEKRIKQVYVGALRCIEMRFGDSFTGYDQLRREILRMGNDAVRDVNQIIDTSFNVEQVPDVLTVRFVNKDKERLNEGTADI